MSQSAGLVRFPAEVTESWLTTVLRERGLVADDQAVTGIERQPVGTGQMADTVRFLLTYDEPGLGPGSIIGKFASTDDQSRGTGTALRSYEIEVSFYRQLAPRVKLRLPGFIYGDVEPSTGWFTLLLEDLTAAHQGDQIAGCDVEVAHAALVELARLHAPCFEAPDLAALDWLNRGGAENDQFTEVFLPSLLPGFLERYRDRLTSEHAHLCERFMANIGTWMRMRTGQKTAVHCDYRLDNFLFDEGDPRPTVVDWQTLGWLSPAYDVAYFVGGCLSAQDRRAHEPELLAHYHEELRAQGVNDYSFETLQADYRRDCFGGLMMAIGASMLVKRTERGDEMFLTSTTRHTQHTLDIDAETIFKEP